MTPNPILKVLSTLRKHKVKYLLIGGQACIIYGAAEFSRDSDFVVLCDEDNLNRLKKALNSLKAKPIYVPSLDAAKKCISERPLLSWAIKGDIKELDLQLKEEEDRERQKDIEYWSPLKKELELLRHQR